MLRFFTLTVMALLVTGCDGLPAQARYQLVIAPDGKLYRLDTRGGALHYVTSDGLHALSEKVTVLRKGEFYELEDGPKESKYLKYAGNGQFEKSAFAVRNW